MAYFRFVGWETFDGGAWAGCGRSVRHAVVGQGYLLVLAERFSFVLFLLLNLLGLLFQRC